MSRNNSTMITPSRERCQHLKFEDRVSIKIYRKLKYTLTAIADVLDCSPSYGTSITERPEEISAKIEEGHWEIDTVVGKRAGNPSLCG